jgi:hypothetical protein
MVFVQGRGGATTVSTGTGTNTVYVGSTAGNAMASPGIVDNIKGALTVMGSGLDTLNVDDTGSTTAKTWTLSSSALSWTGTAVGVINYSRLAVLNINLGTGANSFAITGVNASTATTINGGSNAGNTLSSISLASGFSGVLTVNGFSTISLITDSGDFDGTLTLGAGTTITTITVGGSFNGTLTSTSTSTGTNIVSMNVGVNFTGTVSLGTGTLTQLAITGSSPGFISAAKVGTVTVAAATGPATPGLGAVTPTGVLVVLTVREGLVQRQIEVTPAMGGTLASVSSLVFGVDYQGTLSVGTPQAAIRAPDELLSAPYNLNLAVYNVVNGVAVSHSTPGKFDLTLLYAVASGTNSTGLSGLYDLSIEGDLTAPVTTTALKTFFGSSVPLSGGVQLPNDNIGGVGVRDAAAEGSINVRTLQFLAFGEYQEENGQYYPGNTAQGEDATDLLRSNQAIAAANGTYRVPVGQNYPVAVFIGQSNGQFNGGPPILLTDELMPVLPPVTTPPTLPANFNTAVIATVTVATSNPPSQQQVISIAFSGDGGSVESSVPLQSITSTGSLGDLYLDQGNTAVSVTASSVFGNIDLGGVLSGVIQTTGQRTDPVTGLVTTVSADLGTTHTVSTDHGTTTQATTVTVEGAMTGKLISRGNLISQVNLNGMSSGGVIAAQGNLGAQVGGSSSTTRVGGLDSNGAGLGGDVVVLGSVYGDINVDGGMRSGRLAVGGSDYGNLSVDGGVDSKSAIVVAGSIGSQSLGTYLNLDSLNGILAVEGSANVWHSYTSNQALFNQTNLGTTAAGNPAVLATINANTDLRAISAIFTNNNQILGLDLTAAQIVAFGLPLTTPTLNLDGLTDILTDLNLLSVSGGTLTGTTP